MTRLIDADAFQDEFKDHLEYALKLLTSNRHKNAAEMVESFGKDIKRIIANAPTVQREGWVSVPIEPTKEMVDAGRAYFKDTFDDIFQSKTHYKAMLSAAPKE